MKNYTAKELALLFTPSWLSGLLVTAISIGVVLGSLLAARVQGNDLQGLFAQVRDLPALSPGATYHSLTSSLAQNSLISNLPLFLFWASVGVIVYFFAVSISAALGNVAELEQEMHYMNARRHQLVREALLHLMVRIVALGVWLAYLHLTLQLLLPYSVAAGHAAAGSLTTAAGFAYIVLALVVLGLTLHIHTIFIRLLVLKARVFSSSFYK